LKLLPTANESAAVSAAFIGAERAENWHGLRSLTGGDP